MIAITDVKFALRGIVRNPKFSLLTIFVMMMGLALFIFMYSFLSNTLMAPLKLPDGERIRIFQTERNNNTVRIHEYEDIKSAQQSFDVLDAFRRSALNISITDKVERERGFYVSPTYFEVAAGRPLLGRLFTTEDMLEYAEPVVIISESLWGSLFAADNNVLGQSLRVNNQPHTIVGVMPDTFQFPNAVNLWLPFTFTAKGVDRARGSNVLVYGKLKPRVSDTQANKDISNIVNNLKAQYPKLNAKTSVKVLSLQQNDLIFDESLIVPMQLCVLLILLLVCINTSNLLLSRALEKSKETAIRSALGAPRAQLIAQMMLESLILCSISGVLAMLIANWGVGASLEVLQASYFAAQAPFWWTHHLTFETILLGIGITLLTAIVTGLLPALKATSGDPNSVLRDGTQGAQSKSASNLSSVIVILEIALSCALLYPSASIVYSVHEKNQMDYGARLTGYQTALVTLQSDRYETDEKKLNYFSNLEQKLVQQPGVHAVAYTRMLPVTWVELHELMIEGNDYGVNNVYPEAEWVTVSHNYFDTLDIQLLQGREFDARDRLNTPITAIVTENFVEQHFGSASPIGKRFKLVEDQETWYTVVGVVNNVIHGYPTNDAIKRPSVFVSLEQKPVDFMTAVIDTKLPSGTTRDMLSRTAYQIDSQLAPYRFRTIERLRERALAYMDFLGAIFLSFALVSVVVAFSGIYGVTANTITQKTEEISIRRAIGANNLDVFLLFIKKGILQLALGLMIGLPAGVALLNMVSASSKSSSAIALYVFIPSSIALVVLYAVLRPVKKAVNLEPINALRYG